LASTLLMLQVSTQQPEIAPCADQPSDSDSRLEYVQRS
jgi:hypothetical protein